MQGSSLWETFGASIVPAGTILAPKINCIEVQEISAYINSRLENIDQFLNGFTQQPNEIDVDGFEPDNESVDTPLVSPFLDLDDDYDDGEVLNELEEYDNVGQLGRQRAVNSFDGVTWHSNV
ncbi:hypothetical protein Tco_0340321 [Tanacetum coccineum]